MYYVYDSGAWHLVTAGSIRDASAWNDLVASYGRDSSTWNVYDSPEALFPNSDVSKSGFEDTTGGDGDGTLYDEVADPSVSTYIRSHLLGPGTHYARFGLPNASLDHTIDQPAHIKIRVNYTVPSGDTDQIYAKLYQGGSLVDGSASGYTAVWNITPSGSGVDQLLTYALSSTELSQLSNWTSMEIRIEHVASDVSLVDHYVNVESVELDLDS